MKDYSELFKIAYKKLKSSLYYDRTQVILRDKLVKFEAEQKNIEESLEDMAMQFCDEDKRKKLVRKILKSIDYHVFPKSLVSDESKLIKNYSKNAIELEEVQYFIDMDIEGHIIGVLWLMLIGYKLDKNIYKFSYGNRIRKNLYNELSENPTYSPYLFEPYFHQYESWRDKAMDEAMEHLHKKQDVVVLTLDFKKFYYSVDISEELMQGILREVCPEEDNNFENFFVLNQFVYQVIKKYASLFDGFEGRRILPIGFLPSNILANYALRNFDQAILDRWNPIYFGRYVDDVIIVDKVQNNSELYNKAKDDTLQADDIIEYFLKQCSGWKGKTESQSEEETKFALLKEIKVSEGRHRADIGKKSMQNRSGNDEKEYVLNPLYNPYREDRSKITVKNKKLKIFYFKSGSTDALITCFKEKISKNKSEFRHMPEDESIFQKDDYNMIYDLQNSETINKFRGIQKIAIDKFELSKLLGKYLRIGGLVTDKKEVGIDKHIEKIFSPRVIIENYGVWEKVIEVLVLNESFDILLVFIQNLYKAVMQISYIENEEMERKIKNTLLLYLYGVFYKSMSLVWGSTVEEFVDKLLTNLRSNDWPTQFLTHYTINTRRKSYCTTRMNDKSIMPIFIDMLDMEKIYKSKANVNLSCFDLVLPFCKKQWKSEYYYYPYLITMYDFSVISCLQELKKDKNNFFNFQTTYNRQIKDYVSSNYHISQKQDIIVPRVKVSTVNVKTKTNQESYLVDVDNGIKNKLRIAIANVRLQHDNFKRVVKENPNRSYKRYKDVSKIINEAIDEKADILILPESYLPFEWLSTVARTCARNKLALVTGIEHIKIKNKIFNLSAIVLPYEDLSGKSAFISFHLKTHYAPSEKQEINGYRLQEVTGNHYELYRWHGCCFPVYCCYELTSISERAIFQSYADFLVAIEWNRDINYYSNILESLSRDIHCYCVQVNSSDYGDSRITKPSKTEQKDVIRTKGGINSTILVDEIDIERLRDFQFKEYVLQAQDKDFKPTPPGFDPEIVLKKMRGEELGV